MHGGGDVFLTLSAKDKNQRRSKSQAPLIQDMELPFLPLLVGASPQCFQAGSI
jgi:hypothetical protein